MSSSAKTRASAACNLGSWRELNSALEGGDGFVEIAALLLHQPEGPVRRGEMGIQLDGVITLFERTFEIPLVQQHHG